MGSELRGKHCFNAVQNNTSLKPIISSTSRTRCFNAVQNNTSLKQIISRYIIK